MIVRLKQTFLAGLKKVSLKYTIEGICLFMINILS